LVCAKQFNLLIGYRLHRGVAFGFKALDQFGNVLGFVRFGVVPRIKELYKDPLRPFVIGRGRSAKFSAPVKREANAVQLFPVAVDIGFGSYRRMLARLDGVLLRRQAKRIVAHGMQNLVALVPLESRINVTGDVAQRVSHVQPCPRRVGEHIQHIELGFGGAGLGFEGLLFGPVLLPLGLYFEKIVLHLLICRVRRLNYGIPPKPKRYMKGFVLVLAVAFCCISSVQAQLGFCTGNTGDPIFTEDFGAGLTNGPALPAGTTSYSYVNGAPSDGSYTISSFTQYFDWHNTADHTTGDVNGRSFIVNASFTAGEFYNRRVTGLCENTTYQFAAWLLNLLPSPNACPGGGIPINVRFEIWDGADTQLLASGNTGDIGAKTAPIWENYGLVFQTLPGQNDVILKMINNGNGGCGNDLAIDDITFRPCGDRLELEDEVNEQSRIACLEDGATSVLLEATPDFSVFSTHAYQWQESLDGATWADIPGETNASFQSPPLLSDVFYRVKVAEDPVNLANSSCTTVSDVYRVEVVPAPLAPAGMPLTEFCVGETGVLEALVSAGEGVNWYAAPAGGTPLASNTTLFEPAAAGTYYAETVDQRSGCRSVSRTPFELQYIAFPDVQDEELQFCEGSSVLLDSGVSGTTYVWSTGATDATVRVNEAGTYTVEVTNSAGCSATKTIVLESIVRPSISLVRSEHRDIRIEVAQAGDFEYSVDGFNFQDAALFDNLVGGPYLIVVREKSGCGEERLAYNHLVFPRFFTPNGDLENERWIPEGVSALNSFELQIFDRLGKLIFQSNDPAFQWDGQSNGRPLPASDYWYRVLADGREVKGHFTLKR